MLHEPPANKFDRHNGRRADATGIKRDGPKRLLLDDAEMLNVITALANGGTIAGALKQIRGADAAAFFKTMRRKPKWRAIFNAIKPDAALAMMDSLRHCARAGGRSDEPGRDCSARESNPAYGQGLRRANLERSGGSSCAGDARRSHEPGG